MDEPEQAAGESALGRRRLGARGWWAVALILVAAVVYSVWARRHGRRVA